jgi:Domain of unknown function (DUF4062)
MSGNTTQDATQKPRSAQTKFQVFVSSTYRDLVEERRAVIEAVLAMGHIPVGMEVFEAGNDDQWTYIRNRIDEVDYYLVIVAEHYGSIGKKGLSYTEMEYRYAIEHQVPVAALLLDSKSRDSWPKSKIDFENRDKLEKFRTLCQKRMVAYWSDANSLGARSMQALMGLIRDKPRTGWVSGDQAMSPQLAAELARLSEENARLREEVTRHAASDRDSADLKRLAVSMEEPLITEFRRMSKLEGTSIGTLLADTALVRTLDAATMLGLLIDRTEAFLDGETEANVRKHVVAYLESKADGAAANSSQYLSAAHFLLLRMRVLNLIEAYEGPGAKGLPDTKLRLTQLARRAFDQAFTRHLA